MLGDQMGQTREARLWHEALDFTYLDKEPIFQSGDVLAVTTDLMRVKDSPHEPPRTMLPGQTSLSPLPRILPKPLSPRSDQPK